MKKELLIAKTENRQFAEWLVSQGYTLRVQKTALLGTGRTDEATSSELGDLWDQFSSEN